MEQFLNITEFRAIQGNCTCSIQGNSGCLNKLLPRSKCGCLYQLSLTH